MKTARVFKSGNSQAIRLPKEFQLDVGEVHIFRRNGELVLRPLCRNWEEYFERGRRFSDDFPESINDLPTEEKVQW